MPVEYEQAHYAALTTEPQRRMSAQNAGRFRNRRLMLVRANGRHDPEIEGWEAGRGGVQGNAGDVKAPWHCA